MELNKERGKTELQKGEIEGNGRKREETGGKNRNRKNFVGSG